MGQNLNKFGNENSEENYRFIIDLKDKEIEDLKRTIQQLKLSNDKITKMIMEKTMKNLSENIHLAVNDASKIFEEENSKIRK